MTDRIKEIEERLEKASPGPWSARHDGSIISSDRRIAYVQNGGIVFIPDAFFIAHAPDDIRYLLAELREWRNSRDGFIAAQEALELMAQTAESELADSRRRLAGIEKKYSDLIFCVEDKYPGESRHETAKRFLLDRARHGIGADQAIKCAQDKDSLDRYYEENVMGGGKSDKEDKHEQDSRESGRILDDEDTFGANLLGG
jgi:hypothetical protein